MKKADLVIVGGSAAGIQAAITARKQYALDKIIVIRREQKVLVPCGIPYIMATLGSVDKNVMPDALLGDAELIVDDVTAIDRKAQTVTTGGGETIGYDRLILATGSRPSAPPIPGMELDNVFTVWKDSDYLQQMQSALGVAKDVVIIGGGFIGVEFADECRKMGLNVTLVELLEHCLILNCDEEFCIRIENNLTQAGVNLKTGHRVKSIGGNEKVEYVECDNGERLKADVVIVSIGVIPNNELAREASLEIGQLKGILVDQYMATTDPNIFAVGDCAEKFCFFTQRPTALRLASVATTEARIAGANLFQKRRANQGTIGVFSTMVAGTAIGTAGLTEGAARKLGFDVVVGEAAAVDKHPGSMPGATELRVKLIFESKVGKLIGGQVGGGATAGEIANVIGAAIAGGMTADQVASLQVGTHPALTASPIVYQIVNAAENAVLEVARRRIRELASAGVASA